MSNIFVFILFFSTFTYFRCVLSTPPKLDDVVAPECYVDCSEPFGFGPFMTVLHCAHFYKLQCSQLGVVFYNTSLCPIYTGIVRLPNNPCYWQDATPVGHRPRGY